MSSYLVSAETLANATQAVINSGIDLSSVGGGLNRKRLAETLYAVNKNAVANRYREPEAVARFPERLTPEQFDISRVNTPSSNMESLNSLIYQCSEDLKPEYESVFQLMNNAYNALEHKGIKADMNSDIREAISASELKSITHSLHEGISGLEGHIQELCNDNEGTIKHFLKECNEDEFANKFDEIKAQARKYMLAHAGVDRKTIAHQYLAGDIDTYVKDIPLDNPRNAMKTVVDRIIESETNRVFDANLKESKPYLESLIEKEAELETPKNSSSGLEL